MYQFKYMLNDKDYLEFNKFHLSNSVAGKRTITMLRLFVPVMLLLCLFLLVAKYKDLLVLVVLIVFFTLVSIVWFFLVKPLLIFSAKINIEMIKKDGKLPYSEKGLIQFDEGFITDITNETEAKTKYTSIEKIAVGNSAIYIYISSLQAFIIPFSVFEAEEQRDEFLTFINEKAKMAKEIPQ